MLILSVITFFWTTNLSCSTDSKAPSQNALLLSLQGLFLLQRTLVFSNSLFLSLWMYTTIVVSKSKYLLTNCPSKMLQTKRTV